MAETGKKYDTIKARKMKQEKDDEKQALLSIKNDRHDSDIASKSDLEEMNHSINAQPVNSSQEDINSMYEWDNAKKDDKRTNNPKLTKNGKQENGKSLLQSGSQGPQREYEVNIWYLVFLTLTLGLSSMQFNLSLAGTCQVAPALRF